MGVANELILHTYFKNDTLISSSLYLPYHVLIPQSHTPTSSQPRLCPRVQLIFGPVVRLHRRGGLSLLDILGAYNSVKSVLRGSSLCLLFPPF